MLTKKQNIKDNQVWINAYNNSLKNISEERTRQLEAEAIQLIKEVASSHSSICNGWIAGKDSLVIQHLIEKAGIKSTPIMWRGINEWPSMKAWINENKPQGIIFEIIDKFNFNFLNKHPDYLFCQRNTRQRWMSEKWRRQSVDIKKHGFDLFITGRRIKDGNQCGKKEEGYIVQKDGYHVFAPIAEWSHEELLAYIVRENIQLPPFYTYKRGFLVGSIAMGEWTEYACMDKSVKEVWDEIFEIDQDIVYHAAIDGLDSARNYLINNK